MKHDNKKMNQDKSKGIKHDVPTKLTPASVEKKKFEATARNAEKMQDTLKTRKDNR